MTEVERHTMGPWEVTDQNGDPEGSFRGVRMPTRINILGKPYNTYVAQYCLPGDARLISAAPDLLDACKQAAELFEDDESIAHILLSAIHKATGAS